MKKIKFTPKPSALRKKWRRWIDRIGPDIQQSVISVHIFKEVQGLIKQNKDIQKPSTYYDWTRKNFITTIAVGIRRQMDKKNENKKKDVVSLYKLLNDIKENNKVLTRRSHTSFYKKDLPFGGNSSFDNIAGLNTPFLPEEIPQADIEKLDKAHARISLLVNKKIAHLDWRNLRRKPPTFDEAFEAIFLLEKIFLKYQLLLKGSAPSTLLPTWQYDWKEIFNYKWNINIFDKIPGLTRYKLIVSSTWVIPSSDTNALRETKIFNMDIQDEQDIKNRIFLC